MVWINELMAQDGYPSALATPEAKRNFVQRILRERLLILKHESQSCCCCRDNQGQGARAGAQFRNDMSWPRKHQRLCRSCVTHVHCNVASGKSHEMQMKKRIPHWNRMQTANIDDGMDARPLCRRAMTLTCCGCCVRPAAAWKRRQTAVG